MSRACRADRAGGVADVAPATSTAAAGRRPDRARVAGAGGRVGLVPEPRRPGRRPRRRRGDRVDRSDAGQGPAQRGAHRPGPRSRRFARWARVPGQGRRHRAGRRRRTGVPFSAARRRLRRAHHRSPRDHRRVHRRRAPALAAPARHPRRLRPARGGPPAHLTRADLDQGSRGREHPRRDDSNRARHRHGVHPDRSPGRRADRVSNQRRTGDGDRAASAAPQPTRQIARDRAAAPRLGRNPGLTPVRSQARAVVARAGRGAPHRHPARRPRVHRSRGRNVRRVVRVVPRTGPRCASTPTRRA